MAVPTLPTPAPTIPSSPALPPLDPTAILGKLQDAVVAHQDPAGGGKSWISTIIIVVLVLAAIAVWAWISFKNGRELAELRHEKEVTRIQGEQAAVDAKVATSDAAIAVAQKQVDAATEQLKHIDGNIQTEEARYAADLGAINRIRSWRDVAPSPS